VGQLSRFVTPTQLKKTKADLASGALDVVVGTHALLSAGMHFHDLGMVIVDEEQHFGVKQKERLKQLQKNVHVLTMTATPIPRTLQMALTGVRDMSIIATPPVDRLAIRTFIMPFDALIIQEAIQRERHRGGQIFYVCPRVNDIPEVLERLEKLMPDLRIAVAHGQLPVATLEKVMDDFMSRSYDLLLATNIIESGIDLPSVNTLFVHRPDLFGLSQLYQLRGRIGRSNLRAYAYLLLPEGGITATAQKRLEVMQTLDSLGAGFQLASHDLDIRGAGNLLGDAQSGHIREVGVELYQQMLEETIHSLRTHADPNAPAQAWSPEIHLGLSVLIPQDYVPDLSLRLDLYRRLGRITCEEEILSFHDELLDRFGPLPSETENLLQVIQLKTLCLKAHVATVTAGEKGFVLSFWQNSFPNPQGLIAYTLGQQGLARLRPDHKMVFTRPLSTGPEKCTTLRRILEDLCDLL
jgi:transcription-repair coupling factor (superfamily II helicase)